jgi:nickel-dependent lactate racemase
VFNLEIELPFGSEKQKLILDNTLDVTILNPSIALPENDPIDILKTAFEKPLDSKKLKELSKGKKNVVIVVDDHTRKLATEKILDILVPELHEGAIINENITILIGTATHRPSSEAEIKQLLGKYASQFQIICHNCDRNTVFVGETSYRNKIYLNTHYVGADLKISISDVQMHYFAGLGGGRKTILPGIAHRDSIKKNHSFLLDERVEVGKTTGNPVSDDMTEAANLTKAKPDFSVVVIQDGKNVIHAATGDLNTSFNKMAMIAKDYFLHKAPDNAPFDILVTTAGGHPTDLNIYQSGKAIEHTKCLVKKGAPMILVSASPDGIGSNLFIETLKKYHDLDSITKKVRENFVMGEHKVYYWYKILQDTQFFLVTKMYNKEELALLKVKSYKEIQDAFDHALELVKRTIKNPKIGIVINGSTFAFNK